MHFHVYVNKAVFVNIRKPDFTLPEKKRGPYPTQQIGIGRSPIDRK
jgi:hypothetical protein